MKIIFKIVGSTIPAIIVFVLLNAVITAHVNHQKQTINELNQYKVVHNEKELNNALNKDYKHLIIEDAMIEAVAPVTLKGLNNQYSSYHIVHQQEHTVTTFITQSTGNNTTTLVPITTSTWDQMNEEYKSVHYMTINGIKVKQSLINQDDLATNYHFSKKTLSDLLTNDIFKDYQSLKIDDTYLYKGDDRFYIITHPKSFHKTLIVQVKDHQLLPIDKQDKFISSNFKVKKQVILLQKKIMFWKNNQLLIILIVIIVLYYIIIFGILID